MKGKAIGYLNRELCTSGAQQDAQEHQMLEVAGQKAVDLVKIFAPSSCAMKIIDDPIRRLKIVAERRGATTVIVPSRRHLDRREAEVTQHYTLIEAAPDGGGGPVMWPIGSSIADFHRRPCAEIVT
ncbi:hypothetical protein [Nocardia terpenica]|uniref:Resolvase/invertase-type recombinase catalytic domain-containing protein n=1 Tax=Nocardia terpenica TaxID=455432 RepID=A0A291RKS1_9NOCA|nr:hypothetical protein [Nocardia terpenica]ATL68163.1 hypothetical protein CRH09_20215 [Nocardia terpenica]